MESKIKLDRMPLTDGRCVRACPWKTLGLHRVVQPELMREHSLVHSSGWWLEGVAWESAVHQARQIRQRCADLPAGQPSAVAHVTPSAVRLDSDQEFGHSIVPHGQSAANV